MTRGCWTRSAAIAPAAEGRSYPSHQQQQRSTGLWHGEHAREDGGAGVVVGPVFDHGTGFIEGKAHAHPAVFPAVQAEADVASDAGLEPACAKVLAERLWRKSVMRSGTSGAVVVGEMTSQNT